MNKSKMIFGAIAAVVVIAVVLVVVLNSGTKAPDGTTGTGASDESTVTSSSGPALEGWWSDTTGAANGNGDAGSIGDGSNGGSYVENWWFDEDTVPGKEENPYNTMWDEMMPDDYEGTLKEYLMSIMSESQLSFLRRFDSELDEQLKRDEGLLDDDPYSYITELTYKDLPESNGYYYKNGLITKAVTLDTSRSEAEECEVGFGINLDRTKKYLALNPVIFKNGSYYLGYNFIFEPSAGYVTTIPSLANHEYGTYEIYNYNTTFIRSPEYALPADYFSDSAPGTIWYVDTDNLTGTKHCAFIDVRVHKGEMMCGVFRIYISKDEDGLFYLDEIVDLNQLNNEDDTVRRVISVEDAEMLCEITLDRICEDDTLSAFLAIDDNNRKKYSVSNFIVDYREAGMGTYFSYASLGTPSAGTSEEQALTYNLVAVTIRSSDSSPYYENYAPTTFYYVVLEGAGVNGENEYEYGVVDFGLFYRLKYLDMFGYPEYSKEPSEDYDI